MQRRKGNSDTEYRITDAGDLRGYRTEIPNIVDELGLSIYARGLYQHIKRRAGGNDGGVCKAGTASIASALCISAGMVSKAKQELVTLGLIEIEREDGPTIMPDHITIVDIWPINGFYYADLKGQRTAGKSAAEYLSEWRKNQAPRIKSLLASEEGKQTDEDNKNDTPTPSPHEDPLHTVKASPSPDEAPPSHHEDTPSLGETKNKPSKKEPFKKAAAATRVHTHEDGNETLAAAAADSSSDLVGDVAYPVIWSSV